METVLRVLFFYLFILIGIRILGKREFSQLSPFELVTLLLIPELVQQAIVREDFSATNGVIALSTLFVLVFFTAALVQRSERLEKMVEGTASVLAYEGKFVEETLERERVPPGQVYSAIRRAGLNKLEQVRWALLEPDGRISIIPREQEEKQIKPSGEPVQ